MINRCRFCDKPLKYIFADLGVSPLANAYLTIEHINQMEPFYPLRAYVCEGCFLVQLPTVQSSEEIFSEYAYFSSYSDSWLKHSKKYDPLKIPIMRGDIHIEVPIIFQETDAEAIRSLVFIEKKKNFEYKNTIIDSTNDSTYVAQYDAMVKQLEGNYETFSYDQEKEMLKKKRLEIQRKMEEIEKMFEEFE